jgi:hypothetical protein
MLLITKNKHYDLLMFREAEDKVSTSHKSQKTNILFTAVLNSSQFVSLRQ